MGRKPVIIEIVTLFPDFFSGIFNQSILHRACDAGLVEFKIHNLRDYTYDRHHQADDYRFGGGAGMLLKPEPFFRIFESINQSSGKSPLVIFPTPKGDVFHQQIADDLAREPRLVFLCGHYKGIDQRVIERFVHKQYSIGDYVVTGGEIASTVIIDSVVRMIPGVLGNLDSALSDSFRDNQLDCPHYTRPEKYNGFNVPELLVQGHHGNINLWRQAMSKLITKKRRPDLMSK